MYRKCTDKSYIDSNIKRHDEFIDIHKKFIKCLVVIYSKKGLPFGKIMYASHHINHVWDIKKNWHMLRLCSYSSPFMKNN